MENFAAIQAVAKSQATIKNCNSREKKFLNWLTQEHPECSDDDEESPVLENISATMMCTFIY